MFSRPVRHVAGTHIFARSLARGEQALAYEMTVEIEESLAMVLPLPVPPDAPEDAVRFVSLAEQPRFFGELRSAFPPIPEASSRGGALSAVSRAPTLEVHAVGRFDASFVPTLDDFPRLDPRFRMDDSVWRALPGYADHGFAVFALRPPRRRWLRRVEREQIHPMAFVFPRRAPSSLFFPTLHVHDGSVPKRAHFDHVLYAQLDDVTGQLSGWERSERTAEEVLSRETELVDPGAPLFRRALGGMRLNEDTWLARREMADPALLVQRGRYHLVRVTDHPRIDALASGLARELGALLDARAEEWRLATRTDALPQWFTSNGEVYSALSVTGQPLAEPGPGRLELVVGGPGEGSQRVELAFAERPTRERLAAIVCELSSWVARF